MGWNESYDEKLHRLKLEKEKLSEENKRAKQIYDQEGELEKLRKEKREYSGGSFFDKLGGIAENINKGYSKGHVSRRKKGRRSKRRGYFDSDFNYDVEFGGPLF